MTAIVCQTNFRFYLIVFQLDKHFSSQFCISDRNSRTLLKDRFLKKKKSFLKEQKPIAFSPKLQA